MIFRTRSVEDPSAPIPEERTSELGRAILGPGDKLTDQRTRRAVRYSGRVCATVLDYC
jgi:hypothetical protein